MSTNDYNPNTDLDQKSVQVFIARSLHLSDQELEAAIDQHIESGSYPCWIEDLVEYKAALQQAIKR